MSSTVPPALKGIAIAPGLGRGRAFVLGPDLIWSHGERGDSAEDVEAEIARFEAACSRSAVALETLREALRTGAEGAVAEILHTQELLLHDHVFQGLVSQRIRDRELSAEAALAEVIAQLSDTFADLRDPYIRDRAADLRDVGQRVYGELTGGKESLDFPAGSILVAGDLSPSVAAGLDPSRVAGVVTQSGAKASHVAILLRSLGIPAVGGLADLNVVIPAGSMALVDGFAGLVFVEPRGAVLVSYQKLEADLQARDALLESESLQPPVTLDGVTIRLDANLGKSADVEAAVRWNADGVGLYRTEFAFDIRDRFPTEDEQAAVLGSVAQRLHPRPVVFRLLDIGAEKSLPYFPLPPVPNPALNLRGVRLLLAHPALLRTQLRAILRVSALHSVSVLLPMVGGVEELRAVKAVLHHLKDDLRSRGTPFAVDLPVGVMIEVPSAALVAADLAREVDFLSLGTNDLVQYLVAADREDPAMSAYYRALHPAVLRLIESVVAAAKAAGKPLSICGEMAGAPFYTELLLGLGLRSFSIAPRQLGAVRHEIRRTDLGAAAALARELLGHSTRDEIRELLERRQELRSIAPG
jgi:phosphoenolpyruvate-protein phosphotransferase